MNSTPESPIQEQEKPNTFLLNLSVVILCCVAAIPVIVAYWRMFYGSVLEVTSPVLSVEGLGNGLGDNPRELVFNMEDDGSGLDEIVVRVKQRASSKEVFRQKLNGQKNAQVKFLFDAKEQRLTEGNAKIIVRVFDRAVWSNSADVEFDPPIEYRKPKVRVMTAQHNARLGGVQLIMYTAQDDTKLVESGVVVNKQRYRGIPASHIDPELSDPNLFMTLYGVDVRHRPDEEPQLYALDPVGNEGRSGFTNQILNRRFRPVRFFGSEEQLKGFSEEQVAPALRAITDKIYWRSPFLVPKAAINVSFADELILSDINGGERKKISQGFRFRYLSGPYDVVASQSGVVALVTDGTAGEKVVAIDHGAGLYSIYSHLAEAKVREGASVIIGDAIGLPRKLSSDLPEIYYEIRLQGVPVEPREWWEERWFNDHILRKIKEVKWIYGIKTPKEPLKN